MREGSNRPERGRYAAESAPSGTVAARIAGFLHGRVAAAGRATLAIPGGRSPGAVLEQLASQLAPQVTRALALLWVDERAVSAETGERNDVATLAAWERGGPLPGRVLPMLADSLDLERAVRDYTEVLESVLVDGCIDVCLLGIGEDGHIASLFPQHAGLGRREPVFAIDDSPKPPPERLTMSLPLIALARLRIVLALGEGKRAAYEAAQREASHDLPASLLPVDDTLWFVD